MGRYAIDPGWQNDPATSETFRLPFASNEPAPCDGCSNVDRCGAEELACPAFSAFVGGRSWASLARRPSRDRWRRLFHRW